MRAVVLILLLIGLMAWVGPDFGETKPVIQVADGFMSVESKSDYYEFNLSPAKTYSLYLVELGKTDGFIKTMGFDFHAAMLAPDQHQRFQKIVRSGSCPAAFLNKHAQNFMLAAPNDAVRLKLSKLFGRPNSIQLHLRGNPLAFEMGEVNGIPMKSFNMGGGKALLVEDVQVE